MIRPLEIVEELLWGKPDAKLEPDSPLLLFPSGRAFTLDDAFENVLFIGSPGSGKTSSAKTYYRALLKQMFGGLVLCVKESQIKEFQEVAQEYGRGADVILFGPKEKHVFNPLEGANIGEATSLLVELAEVIRARQTSGSTENEAFWRQQAEMALRNLLVLCRLVHGRFEISLLGGLFAARANTPNQVVDPAWRQVSVMAEALNLARQRAEGDEEARLAVEYFTQEFPSLDRLQSSVAASVSGILEPLRHPPLAKLFGGKSTFSMRDLLAGGKICIVGMPALGWDEEKIAENEGRIANGILQFCFCRVATRGQRESNAFLISDECQETISGELMKKLSVLREYHIATVLLTQSLPAMDARVGREQRAAILSNIRTRVFLRQIDGETREWAAKEIGKCMVERLSENRTWGSGRTGRGEGRQPAEDWRVRPEMFADLKKAGSKKNPRFESIVLKDGKWGRVWWDRNRPGTDGTVSIV
jgi:type IV secretory pathway TraG/TraD family ATPase VirD4